MEKEAAMLLLAELNKKSREEKIAALKESTPDAKIRALLAYLPTEFPSDREILHTAFQSVRMLAGNSEFLSDFAPVPGAQFNYSPLLERVLKRLQEARVLAARNPDFAVFQVDPNLQEQIRGEIPKSFTHDQIQQLKKIANDLKNALKLI